MAQPITRFSNLPKIHFVSVLTLLALLAVCLLALLPLMQHQLPRSADGLLHLYRVLALDDAITRDATLYPRYASNLAYGYGAPLFNYYSPIAYYPAVLLHHLGMTYLGAWLTTMSACTILAALGAYRLGKLWGGSVGGIITAVAYVYAPYFLFDTISRGTLTEVAALALLPWALWAITRLARTGTIGALALTALMAALFIPLHNIITLHGGVLLAMYGLLVWWQHGRKWQTLLLMMLAGILALGMTAFFWLPALGETSAVKIRAITEALDFIDVTRTLRPLTDALALPHTADPTQLQQPIPITLSWIQLLLALFAIIAAIRTRFFASTTPPDSDLSTLNNEPSSVGTRHSASASSQSVMTPPLLVERGLGGEVNPLAMADRGSGGEVDSPLHLRGGARGGVIFFTLTLLLMLFLNTPASTWFWHNIPGLDYTQFAWRTLGMGSLALAVLSGIGASYLLQWAIYRGYSPPLEPVSQGRAVERGLGGEVNPLAMADRESGGEGDSPSPSTGRGLGGGVIFSILLLLLIPYTFAYLYPIYVHPPASSIQDIQAHERASGELALSSYSEYLPTWTHPDALDPAKLRPYFEQNQPVIRLIPPEGVTLNAVDWRGTSAILELTADNPATLVFDWLYIPGWQARFTNAPSSELPLSVEPSPDGFVSVEIPAGTHTLAITLEQTPLQQTAWGITFLAFGVWFLTVCIVGYQWLFNQNASVPQHLALVSQHSFLSTQHSSLSTQHLLLVILVAVALVIFKQGVVDHTENIWRRERFTPDAFNSVQADFNREIALIGVERPEQVESGSETRLRLFWRLSGAKPDVDYSSILELRDSAGVLVANGGSFMPGGLATSNWLPGYYITEEIDFLVQAGTPPGIYTLDVGLYDPITKERLSVINAAGNPEDVKFIIGQIEVSRPSTSPELVQPYTPAMINGEIGIALMPTLSGVKTAMVGEELPLNITWYAAVNPAQDYQVQFAWLNLQAVNVSATTIKPTPFQLVRDYPTTQWQAQDIWRGRYTLIVPADLEAGDYLLIAEVFDAVGKQVDSDIPIDQLSITAPQHTYDLPLMQHDSDAAWENGIGLRGYNVNQSVSTLTLYWQTEQPINQSLRLFVHVLDGETIVAQSDGIPADWTRPTTGWAAGEVITTVHQFEVPLTTNQLRIGWYDPRTNQRIHITNVGDALTIQP